MAKRRALSLITVCITLVLLVALPAWAMRTEDSALPLLPIAIAVDVIVAIAATIALSVMRRRAHPIERNSKAHYAHDSIGDEAQPAGTDAAEAPPTGSGLV